MIPLFRFCKDKFFKEYYSTLSLIHKKVPYNYLPVNFKKIIMYSKFLNFFLDLSQTVSKVRAVAKVHAVNKEKYTMQVVYFCPPIFIIRNLSRVN